jgi:hypothetical protein
LRKDGFGKDWLGQDRDWERAHSQAQYLQRKKVRMPRTGEGEQAVVKQYCPGSLQSSELAFIILFQLQDIICAKDEELQILKMQVADQEIIKDKFEQLQGEVVKVGSKVSPKSKYALLKNFKNFLNLIIFS